MAELEGILGYRPLRDEGQGGATKACLLGMRHGEGSAGYPLTQISGMPVAHSFDYMFLRILHTVKQVSHTWFFDKENHSTKTETPSSFSILED